MVARFPVRFTVGLISVALGFMTITAIRGGREDELLANARESDLVVLLDSLTQRLARLQAEQADLVAARQDVLSGSDSEAIARTREQLEAIQVVNGTIPVEGPGVVIKILDPSRQLTYDVAVSLIQELRDAGAEAIEINGIRVNGRTFFGTSKAGKITVNNRTISSPIRVKAIGSSKPLAVAVQIPGGVGDTVTSLGARFNVVEVSTITINATARVA